MTHRGSDAWARSHTDGQRIGARGRRQSGCGACIATCTSSGCVPYFNLALHLGPSEFVRRVRALRTLRTRRCTSGVDAAVRAARPHICPEEAQVPAGSAIRARHVRVALTSTSMGGSARPSLKLKLKLRRCVSRARRIGH